MTTEAPEKGARIDSPAAGYLLLAGLGLCWGLNWPAMKLAVTVLPIWDFRAACLIFGGLASLLLARAYGARTRVPRREAGPLLLCACFNIVGWQLLTAYGLTLMEAGRASILAFTMPLWAALLSVWVLQERLDGYRIAGLALGLAGLSALLVPEIEAVAAAPWGVAAILGAAVSWAIGTVLMKRFTWSLSSAALSGWQQLVGAVVIGIGALLLQGDVPWAEDWSTAQLLGVIYAVTMAMTFGQWAWFQIVRIFPAPIAAIGSMMVPVIGVFSGALLLGEAVGPPELLSLVLVTGGLFCVLVLPGLRGARR